MLERRHFLASSSTSLALPLAAAALGISHSGHAAPTPPTPISDAELLHQINGRLALQLNNAAAAQQLSPHVLDFALDWRPPTAPIAKLDRIVAYAFGNRPNAQSGNTPVNGGKQSALPDPGPVNEQLADTVYAVYRQRPVKIYAQWEIACFLRSKYQLTDLVSIEPVSHADGSITYLSTEGVAAQIVALEQRHAAGMGTVGIIGFRDHIKRCVLTSQDQGMQAFAPEGVDMPGVYDPQSGQAWTRQRALYLVHDMCSQLIRLRTRMLAAAYPQG